MASTSIGHEAEGLEEKLLISYGITAGSPAVRHAIRNVIEVEPLTGE